MVTINRSKVGQTAFQCKTERTHTCGPQQPTTQPNCDCDSAAVLGQTIKLKRCPWRTRGDVSMKATRSKQFVQERQKPERHITSSCQDRGVNVKAGETFKDQKVSAVVQQFNQDKRKNTIIKSPEDKVHRSFGNLPVLNPERLKAAKAHAEKAVKMHKVFSVQGPYPVIRAALRARGWVEQRAQHPSCHAHPRLRDKGQANLSDTGDDDKDTSDNVEEQQDSDRLYDLMSRRVQNETVYFYWTNRRDAINPNSLQKKQMINHFAEAESFSTKVGLCVNLRNLHWFDSADPDTFFPRCYRLGAPDEKHDFIEDYRRTACTSLFKYIAEKAQGVQGQTKKHSIWPVQGQRKQSRRQPRPVVLSQMIDFAVKVCQEFLESLEHGDIDRSFDTQQMLSEEEWAEFIDSYYVVVHGGAEVQITDQFVVTCKSMLQRMAEVNPQLDIEGIQNIWIIKPGAKSRGRGIKCSKRLDQILRLVNSDSTLVRESKWVVQKYLERPFLVHDTKFDVRQWFLVTDWNPLTVWFYKKCYLRFSTQPYTLEKLDSSVHLCNNSIQKHLRPSQQRHRGIPADNMWSDDQFRTYLSSQGKEAQWQAVVVPGMKRAVIHALRVTQDLIDPCKNTFELYGADFMMGRDLHPWLIEINVSPTMAPSTPVTARLCAAVQEDTLRVVLDRREDPTADTGDFELICKQVAVEVPQYVGVNLLVKGSKIKCPHKLPPLRPLNHSALNHCGPAKDTEQAVDKEKPLPKRLFKSAELCTGVVQPPLPSKLEAVVKASSETLHLPIRVTKLIQLPISAQTDTVIVKAEAKVIKNLPGEIKTQLHKGVEKSSFAHGDNCFKRLQTSSQSWL